MSATQEHTQWVLDLVDGMSKNLKAITDNVQGLTVKLDGAEKAASRVDAVSLSAIAGSFDALHNRLNEAVQPGIRFQDQMADLEALTGVTGKGLETIGNNARDLTKELGGEAADSLEVYKLLLGQLTPELAKQPKLLNDMARNAILLGKTMGGDTTGAVEVLTTAMNQFGVDTDNPLEAGREITRMMNAMAAAAAAGSAELPQLKGGLIEAGGDAKRAGVSFEETVAALEVLDKAGLKESRGGVALRNVLSTLSQGRFLPDEVLKELKQAHVDVDQLGNKGLTLKQRLELLKPVYNDTALMTKLFGRETAGGANALMSMSDLLGQYTEQVTGTNTANEQAAVIMGTFSQKVERMKAWVSDLGISIFNSTQRFLPFLDAGFSGISMLADLTNAKAGLAMILDTRLFKAIGSAVVAMRTMSVAEMLQAGTTGIVTAATAAFNAVLALNPIVWVVGLIGLLVGALLYAWNHFEGFRGFLTGLWETVKVVFGGIWDIVRTHFGAMADLAVGVGKILEGVFTFDFDAIKEGWAQVSKGAKDMVMNVVDSPSKFKEIGLQSALAFGKGYDTGVADFRTEDAKRKLAESGGPATDQGLAAGLAAGSPGAGKLNAGNLLGASSDKGKTVSGSGHGDKNISINITLQQRFLVDQPGGFSLEECARKTVELITNYTRDAAYTF